MSISEIVELLLGFLTNNLIMFVIIFAIILGFHLITLLISLHYIFKFKKLELEKVRQKKLFEHLDNENNNKS